MIFYNDKAQTIVEDAERKASFIWQHVFLEFIGRLNPFHCLTQSGLKTICWGDNKLWHDLVGERHEGASHWSWE